VETELIISGAGAAGLTLAIDLARRQVPFLLIDKAPHPFVGSRGKGIQPRTTGAAGLATRLFRLFHGGHWTLFGYEVDAAEVPAPRRGLHIHTIGRRGEIHDIDDHVVSIYGRSPGEWVLVRPDGYVASVFGLDDMPATEDYLDTVGVRRPE
jgi:glycine/D-amino acid oxidase-like deaminating enzyme